MIIHSYFGSILYFSALLKNLNPLIFQNTTISYTKQYILLKIVM